MAFSPQLMTARWTALFEILCLNLDLYGLSSLRNLSKVCMGEVVFYETGPEHRGKFRFTPVELHEKIEKWQN